VFQPHHVHWVAPAAAKDKERIKSYFEKLQLDVAPDAAEWEIPNSKFGELAKQSQKCLRRIWGEYQTSIKNAQPGSVVTRSMANANAEAPTEADVNAQDLTISPAEERTNVDMASGVANDTAATNASRTAPVAAQ
jgi:exonuclease III